MINDVLMAHRTSKHGVGYVTEGFPRPKGVSPLAWKVVAPLFNPVAAVLTTGGMPPRTREILGLPWSDSKARNYRRFAAPCRTPAVNRLWAEPKGLSATVLPSLPEALRPAPV